jgi:hemerythrin
LASLAWDNRFNPSIEILYIQHNKISECMKMLYDEISNPQQRCPIIIDLLDQLELLFQLHYNYWEQLVEEFNYSSAVEQKKLHTLFLSAIHRLKVENNQCNREYFFNEFIKLRLEHIENTNNETKVLCNIINNNFT